MLRYAFVTTILLFGAAMPARAQNCLHQQNETAEDRIRREQAFLFARRLNAAQHMMLPGPPGQRYRHPDVLRNLPPVPPGFQLQFHTDGRTYTFSLKDTRDACRFAVFSDQEGFVYAATPQQPSATIIPLETR